MAALLQRSVAADPGLSGLPAWKEVLEGRRFLRWGTVDTGVVRGLQGALGRLGFDPGPLDGIWGPRTNDAVIGFQQSRELGADGVVGPKTATALDAAAAAAAVPVGTAGQDSAAAVSSALGVSAPPAGTSALAQLARMVGLPPSIADGEVGLPEQGRRLAADLVGALGGGGPTVQTLRTAVQRKHSPTNAAAVPGTKLAPDQMAMLTQLLGMLIAAVDAGSFTMPAPDLAAVRNRLVLMQSFAADQQAAVDAGATVDSRALTAVLMAQSMVGAADSTKPDGLDTSDRRQRQFRKSRDVLLQFFDVAFGGKRAPEGATAKEKAGDPFWYDPDIVLHITPGKKQKATKKDGTTTVEVVDAPDTLQDWCGIFPLWAMRSAGFNVGTWRTGSTISQSGGFRLLSTKSGDKVRPGDVGEVGNTAQHQIIVVRVHEDGDTLDTVEGNTDSAAGSQGGQVAQHFGRRKISTTKNGFFRPNDSLTV